jgi:hypothetical protein
LSGGSLGGGPFDPLRLPAGALALVVFGWIAVPGALVGWLPTARFSLVPAPRSWDDDSEDEPEDDPEDAEDTDTDAEVDAEPEDEDD